MRIIKEKKIADPNAIVPVPSLLLGSFFLVGLIPKASGTFGSLAALIVIAIQPLASVPVLLLLILIFFIAGIISARPLMRRYGDDPSVIVVDEVIGMWITIVIFLIFSITELTLFYVLLCFLAFRFFDIVKLQPARYFDELHSPFGVMADDLVAGVYAGISCVLFSLTGFNPF